MSCILKNGEHERTIYVLFDSGCSSAAILTVAVDAVNIVPVPHYCCLSVFDENQVGVRDFASFEIMSLDKSFCIPVREALVGDSLTTDNDQPLTNREIIPFNYLDGVVFDELEDPTIAVILGVPYAWLWLDGETKFHSPSLPLARKTQLGWVLIGPALGAVDQSAVVVEGRNSYLPPVATGVDSSVSPLTGKPKLGRVLGGERFRPTIQSVAEDARMESPNGKVTKTLQVCLVDAQKMSLSQEIKRMNRHDFIMPGKGVHSEVLHPSRMDEFSKQQMNDSVRVEEISGRYIIALPWRNGRSEAKRKFALANSYANAKRRLLRERVKFEKDPARTDCIFAHMKKFMDLGYVREVVKRDLSQSPIWYCPVVIALQPQKPLHKRYRLCQDSGAKCPTAEGPVWLNSELSIGPDILTRMTSILFKFRRHPVTLMADIADFFHRIFVADEDVAALRFLFFADKSLKQIVELESPVHIFGAGSSPTVANFALQHHAHRIRAKYGDVIFAEILSKFYVDDYLTSLESAEKAREVKIQMSAALKEGGFELTKWASNDDSVLVDPSSPADSQVPTNSTGASFSAPNVELRTTLPCPTVIIGAAVISVSSQGIHEKVCEMPLEEGEDEVLLNNEIPSLSQDFRDEVSAELFSEEWKGFVRPNEEDCCRVLGVGYDKKQDVLFVRIPSQADKEVNTMTDVLSIVSSYFDPLGLSAPYCLTGRLIFQECNQRKLGWRDPLPLDLKKRFIMWLDHREGLRQISVPRWSSTWELVESRVDLCVFGDSSREAYGACAYLRRYLPDESVVISRLAFGKGHVIPLSMHIDKFEGQLDHNGSIPRCELTAARLGAEICSLLQRESEEVFDNIYLFTDSMSILLWIRDLDKKHRSFEFFRLRRIWSITEDSWWNYCPTEVNPADVLTHSLLTRAKDADRWRLYLNGPEFLLQPRKQWPSEPKPTKLIGMAVFNALVDFDTSILFPARFGSRPAGSSTSGSFFSPSSPGEIGLKGDGGECATARHSSDVLSVSLAPVQAAILPESSSVNFVLRWAERESLWAEKVNRIARFKARWLKFRAFNHGELVTPSVRRFATPSEFKAAELLLLGAIQKEYFSEELHLLLKRSVFQPDGYCDFGKRQSRLTNMNPFIDGDLILRAGSRIGEADVAYDTKYPIILPSKSAHVQSLILHAHCVLGHALTTHLFHFLRRRFMILGGKAAITRIIRYCVGCQKEDKRPTAQKMAPLPESRVTIVAPFRDSALDALGPFEITHYGRGVNKRYILLITCMSTRAISLFPLVDMSTQSFLNSLTKFQSIYPGLRRIYCDNGTNFSGAANLCRKLVEEFNSDLGMGEMALRNIEFLFNCPFASHSGGVFERLVRSVKRTLHFVLGHYKTNFDSFDTALFKCSSILNSRPLSYASSDATSSQCLSPQDFLTPYLFDSSFTLDPPVTVNSADLRGSWGEVRRIADHFKDRWQSEYLVTLRNRQKWLKVQKELYIGQLVLISGPNTSRAKWPLGRVEDKLPAIDGITRRYMIRMPEGNVLERHHNLLVPLELEYPALEENVPE